jgi:hypothetical protein
MGRGLTLYAYCGIIEESKRLKKGSDFSKALNQKYDRNH